DRQAAYFAFLLKNVEHFFRPRQYRGKSHAPRDGGNLARGRYRGRRGVRPALDLSGSGNDIRVKGWKENIAWTFLYRQYYFERGGVEIKPAPGDHVVDPGGCFGDTALGFANTVGERGHVYVY